MKRKLFHIISISLLTLFVLSSCVDEAYTSDPSAALDFSVRTLQMDTTFSSTSTWQVIVYNRNSKALSISSARLCHGTNFRFNIDGRSVGEGETVSDITVRANDSIFVLVQGERPALGSGTFLVTDSLQFVTNGNTQYVGLELTCIDATVLRSCQLPSDQTLTADKPYLIIDYLYVPEGTTLTLNPGAQLFMHTGANLIVDGTLRILGTPDNEVTIRGERFDAVHEGTTTIPYSCIPGQWGGIYLQNAQSSHIINSARVIGMDAGIILFGASRSHPSLRVRDSYIHCSSTYGIYSQLADIDIANCEISNCGASCLIVVGGTSTIRQTTIANFYTFATRQYASLRLFGYIDNSGVRTAYNVDRFVMENCIVAGNASHEFNINYDSTLTSSFNLYVSHSLIRDTAQLPRFFSDCVYVSSTDDLFVRTKADYDSDPQTYFDFHLAENSPALGIADPAVSALFPLTLDRQPRNPANPGAY